MIRKYINESNIKKALLILLIGSQVLAFTTNGFKLYPKIELSNLIPGLFIYGPVIFIYIYFVREVCLSLFRTMTVTTSVLTLPKLKKAITKPKNLIIPLFFIVQPFYVEYATKLINWMYQLLSVPTTTAAKALFTTALADTVNLTWGLMLLCVTTVVGFVSFNIYTKQLVKFKFIRKHIIRPIDDLINWVPYTALIYFLYILAV